MLRYLVLALSLAISSLVYSNEIFPGVRPGVPLVDVRGSGIALNLGDDQVSQNIPLPFNVTLFGKNFNSVWVSNNGVISFSNGNITGYNSEPLNALNSAYNYALFPLWTDLINHGNANPYYRIDSNTAIFGWYGSKEYSNNIGRNFSNTFEVQVWNNSAFEFRYQEVNVIRQPFTIGYTGDIAAGEYKQWARHPGGNFSANNFSFYSDAVNQCQINPLSSITCEGYQQAYFNLQCSMNSLYSISCPGYEQAILEQMCPGNPLYSISCPGYSREFATRLALQGKEDSTKIQNKNIEVQVVEEISNTTSVDVGGVQLTTNGSISIATGIPEVSRQSSDKTKERSPALAFSNQAIRNLSNVVNSVLENTLMSSMESQNNNSLEDRQNSRFNMFAQASETSDVNRVQQLRPNNEVKNNTTTVDDAKEKPLSENLRGSAVNSDLPERIDMRSLAVVPNGFNSYLNLQLRDSVFYSPREIYRNQTVIDNNSVLRQLNSSSSRLFDNLVQDQYRR